MSEETVLSNEKKNRSTSNSQVSNTTVSMMFRIPGNKEHVITLASEQGTIKVWNMYSGECIRTLTGLKQPRNMKMCSGVRAVVLCDRELHIYDLDKGCLVSRLKGVLNLKMPYFGVHDELHTMALSRNRMYVNIINNHTGHTNLLSFISFFSFFLLFLSFAFISKFFSKNVQLGVESHMMSLNKIECYDTFG